MDNRRKSNRKIEKARKAALSLLKPTPKELEHGLELHRQSVVCESYGFCPRTSPDADAVNAAFEKGATDAELSDLSLDGRLTRVAEDPDERREFEEAFGASGVTCVLQNAGEETQSVKRVLHRMAQYTYVTDMMRDFVFKATKPDDIVKAKQEGRHCLYLTCCSVPLDEQWRSAEEELQFIRVLFQLGARMMHLTYNRRNMIGDGCAEPGNAGLSDFGRTVVAEMNRVGVIVDVAHSGQQTSLEAAKCSSKPVVASHSGCSALSDHVRCKSDEVIKAIVDSGGLIGICCIPRFLQQSGDILAMLAHVDHVVQQFGADHAAIGTDVAYESQLADSHWERMPRRRRTWKGWEDFWPPEESDRKKRKRKSALSSGMAWTNWPLFTVGLVQKGYSDKDIQKIIGGNVLRVARAALS